VDQYNDGPAPHLPRSVLLALWLGAGPGSGSTPERVARVVQGDDEPHDVEGSVGTESLQDLVQAWTAHAAETGRAVGALLPAAGDLSGTPAEVSADTLAAGECVVFEGATDKGPQAFVAVPDVRRFGSDLEFGHEVTWHVQPVSPWTLRALGDVGTVEDAGRGLRTALATAVEALDSLDVASWRDDAADAIAGLREPVDLRSSVPGDLEPQRVRLLSQALRLGAIAQLGRQDDGAAVNVFQSDQRGAALRSVERAARRAMSAATLRVP
jgi:hypothetical protein